MTKDEAIEWLKSLNYCDGEETQEVAQAIDIAIKALEQQPSEDCVSRAEVDKLCVRYLKSPTDDHVAFYEEFCSLPPVTPTHCMAEVKFSKEELREICEERIEIACQHGTCKDCKHCDPYEESPYFCKKQKTWINRDNFGCTDFERRE